MKRTLLKNFGKARQIHLFNHATGIIHIANFNLCASSLQSHYEVLGLKNDATLSEIKTAFYQKSKQHHPDTSASSESKKDFLAICKAYETLKNKDTRRQYDYFLFQKGAQSFSNIRNYAGHDREFTRWKQSNQGSGQSRGYTYQYVEKYEKIEPSTVAIFFGFIFAMVYLINYERRRRINKVYGRGNYSGYSEPTDVPPHMRRIMQARREHRRHLMRHHSKNENNDITTVETESGISENVLINKENNTISDTDSSQSSLSDLKSWK